MGTGRLALPQPRLLGAVRGGGEWEEGLHEDWPWLRKVPPGVLVLEPERSTAADGSTAQVQRGSSTIGVSVRADCGVPWLAVSCHQSAGQGYFPGRSPCAREQHAHPGRAVYGRHAAAAASYWLRQFDYPLATDLLHLIEPLHTDRVDYDSTGEIRLTSDATLAEQWPRDEWASGVPSQCALVGVHPTPAAGVPTLQTASFGQTILRVNRCANAQTGPIRVEYAYTFLPPLLTQTTGVCDEVPLCPPTQRWTLVDLALYLFALDRNDTRADGYVIFGKNGLRAAQRESRHQMAVTGRGIGRIYPRGAAWGGQAGRDTGDWPQRGHGSARHTGGHGPPGTSRPPRADRAGGAVVEWDGPARAGARVAWRLVSRYADGGGVRADARRALPCEGPADALGRCRRRSKGPPGRKGSLAHRDNRA